MSIFKNVLLKAGVVLLFGWVITHQWNSYVERFSVAEAPNDLTIEQLIDSTTTGSIRSEFSNEQPVQRGFVFSESFDQAEDAADQTVPQKQSIDPHMQPYPEDALVTVLHKDMVRLGADKSSWVDLIGRFLRFVKIVESNGDRNAQASTSTAMSYYQFTIPSVPTGVNRLANYMKRHDLGPLPQWAVDLKQSPKTLFDISEERQAMLAMINIIEQRGSDKWLRKFLGGDVESAKTIYYMFHHTDPDQATRNRVNMIFAQVFAD